MDLKILVQNVVMPGLKRSSSMDVVTVPCNRDYVLFKLHLGSAGVAGYGYLRT